MQLEATEVASPIGRVTLAMHEDKLCALAFTDRFTSAAKMLARRFGAVTLAPGPAATAAAERLSAYFGGDRRALDGLAVDTGGTSFQQRVWTALRTIPWGTTTSYREVARAVGAPDAVRAVGAANGSNPVWLVIPCHRVIGADGSLVGYGGGLERKRWLLVHEGALLG